MELAAYILNLPLLLLASARLTGMMLVAPAFGHAAVPMRLRLFAAITMALGVAASRPGVDALPATQAAWALAVAGEVLVGLAIGYIGKLVFVGVHMGAFHVGQQMGVSLAEVFNPSGADEGFDSLGRLFGLLAIVLFLTLGGHRVLIRAVLDSFDVLPPTALARPGLLLPAIVAMLAAGFEMALKVAGPVLAALLLATAALGLLQRMVPQLNILTIGLPIRVVLVLLVLAATLGVMLPIMGQYVGVMSEQLTLLLQRTGRVGT